MLLISKAEMESSKNVISGYVEVNLLLNYMMHIALCFKASLKTLLVHA